MFLPDRGTCFVKNLLSTKRVAIELLFKKSNSFNFVNIIQCDLFSFCRILYSNYFVKINIKNKKKEIQDSNENEK